MTHFCRSSLLVLCLLLLVAAGCRRSDKEFTLKGDLRHLEGNELYLLGTQKPFDRIDTIHAEDGRFTYQAETDTLLSLTLLFNGTERVPLFVDKGTTVTLAGDALQPDSIRISGGEANEELNRFKQQIAVLKDTAQWVAAADSFIRTHPFSQVSVYLLNRYFVQTPRPDFHRIDTLIESMSGMLHDHPLVLSLQKKIENSIKADTGRYISNFRMKNQKGENLTPYRFRDKVLVVAFWATWHPASVAMVDTLKTLQQKLKKEEVAFVYTSIDMDRHRWDEAVKNDTLHGTHTYEGDGWESTLVKQFAVEKLPTVVVLNPQRKVIARSADIRELTDRINAALKLEKERKNKQKKR